MTIAGTDLAAEARDVIAGGLKKAGLDPAQIRYVIIGHGHNDDTGGGVYLQNTYRPRVEAVRGAGCAIW